MRHGERSFGSNGQARPAKTTRDTLPFSAYEWMLASRYLRARRAEGFISVIAGFSFTGIMLGVATLIIVMAVMNGFRNELFSKILGLNGHVIVNKIGGPFDDYDAVAKRIAAMPGVKSAMPLIEGQVMVSSAVQATGALVRGMTRGRACARCRSSSDNIRFGTLDGFGQGSGIAIGTRLANMLRVNVGDTITLVSPRGASTPFGTAPRTKPYVITALFEMGMAEYDRTMVFMPLLEAQRYFSRGEEVDAIEIVVNHPEHIDSYVREVKRHCRPDQSRVRLAGAQRDFLHRARGRAQRDVHHPVADRAGRRAQHHLRPDDAGEGQGARRRHPAHDGRDARGDDARLPHHRRLDRRRRHPRRAVLGIVFCLNIERIRELVSWMTSTTLFDPNVYYLTRLPADMEPRETATIVLMALAVSVLATLYPSWRASTLDPVEALRYE